MKKTRTFLKLLLIITGLLPFLLVVCLFFPDVQKYLIKHQSAPWLSQVEVDTIHITPFAIKIDNLAFQYESMHISIRHLDSKFSLKSLLSQRIKIDKFLLNKISILDETPPAKTESDSTLLFPGLFPYLDTGFVLDIGQLDINADYHSKATGKVQLQIAAHDFNERTNTPLKLNIKALELPEIPDIKGATLAAEIILNQHINSAIDVQNSVFNLKLISPEEIDQFIKLNLSMKQLARPPMWDSFPFNKHRTHYLKEILHPENIELQIIHTDQNGETLADILFQGIYNGNEGIISGTTEITTKEDFLKLFKSLKLPQIKSDIAADFEYNTQTFQGNINLENELNIRNFANKESSSLPEKIDITNQLMASINNDQLLINHFLLDISSAEKDVISIATHKALSINLSNLPSFLDQQESNLLTLDIKQLPLNWFNDFISDYQIIHGVMDTEINLSIDKQTLSLNSTRPLSLQQLSLEKLALKPLIIAQDIKQQNVSIENSNEAKKADPKNEILIKNQNLESDFSIIINQEELLAKISRLDFFQSTEKKSVKQITSSFTLNLKQPLENDFINKPLKLNSKGYFAVNELLKIPYINNILSGLSTSFPKKSSFNYELELQGESGLWTLNKSNFNLTSNNINKDKHGKKILQITNLQKLQVRQQAETFILQTKGKLLATQINQFDFNWISPILQQYIQPYNFSGILTKFDSILSAKENETYLLDINTLAFNNLSAVEQVTQKDQKKTQLLFENLNINSQLHGEYSPDKIIINYPLLSLKKNKTSLLNNSGSIIINNQGDKEKQTVSLKGKLNGSINRLMNLSIVRQNTHYKLLHPSLLNSNYNIFLDNKLLTIKNSDLKVSHPKSNGDLLIQTHKPISLSLEDKKYSFSRDGHLSFKLNNFDLLPYEAMIPDLPLSFDHANGHIELIQTKNQQNIVLKEPLKLHNIHFIKPEEALLDPFDVTLNFSAQQIKNKTQGQIKHLSIKFLNENKNALYLATQFKLNLDKPLILTELDGNLELAIPQWLSQPAAIPDNTLTQGSLNTQFSLDKHNNIKHQWHIDDLIDQDKQKIIESIIIDGTGKLHNLSHIALKLPIVIKSLSGTSNIEIDTEVKLLENKKEMSMNIVGQEVFLNDLLKLLSVINPQSEISQLDSQKENEQALKDEKTEQDSKILNNTPATSPFWPEDINISSKLDIDKLYYSDYMSFDNIAGELVMDEHQLNAKGFTITFHESPMRLDTLFKFNKGQKQPYDINSNLSINKFHLGEFLHELDPTHVPVAEGVFDVAVKIFGDLSNLTQIRNELLFDMSVESHNGVYHLIASDDVAIRSSGYAMAVVGEVVSVLPTSGFGLGIINRVVRFTKDIHYDAIRLHLIRESNMNTHIKELQILSPELRLLAEGNIKFQNNTRVIDQPMEMNAQLNLAGEGAAIFYGLGLLHKEEDEYGFWKGPTIKFWGTLNKPEDNFEEIINKAKEGTLLGGVTNPFSGLVGNFKYRWFGKAPHYSDAIRKIETDEVQEKTHPNKTSLEPKEDGLQTQSDKKILSEKKAINSPIQPKIKPKSKPTMKKNSFFEDTFL